MLKLAGFVVLLSSSSLLLGVCLAFVPPPTPLVPSAPYTSDGAASLPSRRLGACLYFLSNSFPYSPALVKTSMFSPMVLEHMPSCAVPRRYPMMRHPFLTSVTVGFDAFVQSWLTAYRISGYYILVMNKICLTNDLMSAGMVPGSGCFGDGVTSCQRSNCWCSGLGIMLLLHPISIPMLPPAIQKYNPASSLRC